MAELDTPVNELRGLLEDWAQGRAAFHRANPDPKYPADVARRGELSVGAVGIEIDEAAAFVRAYRAGIVTVDPDGRFFLPRAGACPDDLHLVGRSGDQIALWTEPLIHVGTYAELVLDGGWDPARLFFERGAWDIVGTTQRGREALAVEAKARVKGSNSLTGLRASFEMAAADSNYVIPTENHRRKWEALVELAEHGPVAVGLVASGARWVSVARSEGDRVALAEWSEDAWPIEPTLITE